MYHDNVELKNFISLWVCLNIQTSVKELPAITKWITFLYFSIQFYSCSVKIATCWCDWASHPVCVIGYLERGDWLAIVRCIVCIGSTRNVYWVRLSGAQKSWGLWFFAGLTVSGQWAMPVCACWILHVCSHR